MTAANIFHSNGYAKSESYIENGASKLNTFFKNHTTVRKIVVYAPDAIVYGLTIAGWGAYFSSGRQETLITLSMPVCIGLSVVGFFYAFASHCERSLKNKTIEHLTA